MRRRARECSLRVRPGWLDDWLGGWVGERVCVCVCAGAFVACLCMFACVLVTAP